MANYTTKEHSRAEIVEAPEAGHPPRRFPKPTGACGAPAAVCVSLRTGNLYFCEAHRAEADAGFERR